ncbi:hypothetical protein R3P38DRAFT_2814337 [Favolaschia claudopus]|uniref:Uncharacterized protein n=1 Tax=Favolaschia claudopus TaxID=2862362 RepID=A0AAV9Z3H9_9AGAR
MSQMGYKPWPSKPQITGLWCPDKVSGYQLQRVETLAIFPGNSAQNSCQQGPKTVEFWAKQTAWEGILGGSFQTLPEWRQTLKVNPSYGNGESVDGFRKREPVHGGIQPKVDTVGGNSAQDCDSPPETTGIHPKDWNPAQSNQHTAIVCLTQDNPKHSPLTERNNNKTTRLL